MMLHAICTPVCTTRPSSSNAALTLLSSFKGLSLKSTKPVSVAISTPALQLVAQPVAAAGYKLRTHKAAAKRFSVTGSGRITRRSAGRAHLLQKKTTKRKNRLSGKTDVKHCDWQNVIGALPYLRTKK